MPDQTESNPPRLRRQLSLAGATFIGLGSMIGAGVFSAYGPAAQTAGRYLLISIGIAGLVALFNAMSSMQLATQFPTSGGTYAFGREMLGPWWGFVAGWAFVIGKLASSSAIALTFASFLAPSQWQRPVAIGAVVVITAINLRGITRTARMAALIVFPALVILVAVISIGFTAPRALPISTRDVSLHGVLQAAGIFFFAFAGYARLATLGEEVINPRQTIRRAISISLFVVFVIYAAMGLALMHSLGAEAISASSHPALDLVSHSRASWMTPATVIGVSLASLGSLLALIAGISRTMFAMARESDLPKIFSTVDGYFNVPKNAELVAGAIVIATLLVADIRGAIGFSSAGVLLYYFITNVCAFKQTAGDRLFPRWAQIVGGLLCLVLLATLPVQSLFGALAVIMIGVSYRLISIRRKA